MTSTTRWVVLQSAVVMVAVAAGCSGAPPQGAAPATAPPPATTAVGPLPGPETSSGTTGKVDGTHAPTSHGAVNPYGQDRAALGEGRQLFVRFNCSGCHGGRAGGGMGPSLRDVDWIYGSSDAQLFSSIVEGRAHGMPSWQHQLTSDEIWKLVAYIKSLRSTNEPQAPPSD